MRIALYTDSYTPSVDGVSAVVQAYARELPRFGAVCCVFAPAFPGTLPAVGVRSIPSIPLPKGFQYRLALPAADWALRASERAFAPDLIHAHSPFAVGRRAMQTARRLGVPFVASFHTDYCSDLMRALHTPRLAAPFLRQICSFYEAADDVWTMNSAAADILRSYGFRGSISLLPHGVTPESGAAYLDAAAQTANRLRIDTRRLTFLFVGQIIRQKNIALTLKALALLRGRLDFQMFFVGKGRDLCEFRALADSLGLSGRVFFTGYLPDRMLHGMYALADLFLFPSRYDTAGLVVAEAAAAAVPALVLRGSGASSGIADGVNGFLCEESPASAAAAIERAATDRQVLHPCGQAAQRTLVFRWPDICRRAALRYRALIDSASTRPIAETLS